MVKHHHAWLHLTRVLTMFAGCSLALAVLFWHAPAQAASSLATPTSAPPVQLSLQVAPGFDASYRAETWTPAHIDLNNTGADFSGTLTVSTYAGSPRSTTIAQVSSWSFEEPVSLHHGTHTQVTIYVPFSLGNLTPRGFVASLRDQHGKVVATDNSTTGFGLTPGDLFMGWLSNVQASIEPMNGTLLHVTLPNQKNSLTTAQLDAQSMPTQTTVLDNFDIIVLADFDTTTLSSAQLSSLQTWVNRGGILLEIGGSQWQRTLGSLPPDLLPVTISGTRTLPAGTPLFPINGPTLPATASKEPVVASTANLQTRDAFSSSETLLAADTTPLIVKAHQGQGTIYYLAFDPASAPLANWTGRTAFWQTLLLHALGDKLLISNTAQAFTSGPGQLITHGGVLLTTEPPAPIGPWIIGLLLLAYLLMIGPVRLLLVKRLKLPRGWGWRIFLGSAAVFSLLAYTIAFYQQGASLTDNSISLIQINQTGSAAHITTYMGVFVPSQGDFALHFPGETLAQPVSSNTLARSSAALAPDDPSATTIATPHATDLTLHNLSQWTFHPIVAEQDRQLHGGITTHLALNGNVLTGTISNTLPTDLSDVYVLLSHHFAHIAHIAAGETQHVQITLNNVQDGKTLADHLALQGGLAAAYFPYQQRQQPQTDFQRHMALLSALTGSGFDFQPCNGPCGTHAITSRGIIFTTGGQVPKNISTSYDPLLLAGAPATLIAWADHPVMAGEAVTINGSPPASQHENFIQMPLNIDLSNETTIASDLVTGQVIDVQSYDAQALLPDIYSLANGSITFELTAPNTVRLPIAGLTINNPDLAVQSVVAGQPSTSISRLQAHLYNWRTNTWDSITFAQGTTFSTPNTAAYLGSSGRVLMQISSQDTTRIYFNKPTLGLHG